MSTFSQRMGLDPTRSTLQTQSVDDRLRTALWNAAVSTYVELDYETALDHLADRESPDYRNSIKESISAVESLCKLIAGDKKATLSNALDTLEQRRGVDLHKALRNAFCALYGYTSDASGIRHALLDEPDLDIEDATFMLVTRSAFVNYVLQKATKAGIDLEGA